MPRFSLILARTAMWSVCLALAACASQPRELNSIYARSAQYHGPERNPVIVIPGILGSVLVESETQRTVWGAFKRRTADPRTEEGTRLLALPIAADTPLDQLRDDVRPDGVLDQVRLNLLGIPVAIRAYVGILNTLGAGGYTDEATALNGVNYGEEHFTCFQFAYDWRRDNVENAQRLSAFIEARRSELQDEYETRYGIKDADIKFDIVAHSMGGLLTRYFMRYGDADLPADGSLPELTWAGAEHVGRVVLVGTPNAGAGEAFEQLLNGYDPGRPVLPHYPASVLGTYPSVYQLLPRPRHQRVVFEGAAETPIGDLYDSALWDQYGWGIAARNKATRKFLETALPDIADPDERRRIATGFQATALKRARQFHAAMDVPATLPEDVDLYLFAGDLENTVDRVQIDPDTGKGRVKSRAPGDGTVVRYSTLMDERTGGDWSPYLVSPIDWTDVNFISADHIGLTSDPSFANNVLYLLLEEARD
jgi:pimeloyl-ACP methyl ester carboxylesterase